MHIWYSLGVLGDHSFQSSLVGSLHLFLDLTSNVCDESGHAVDAELLSDVTSVINIYLDKDCLSLVLLCQLLINGLDHLARRAPCGGEVHDNGEFTC